jgi:hypothetical protein
VVRLDRALPAHGRPSVTAAPSLLRGQVFPDHQRFFGGTTPGRLGAAASQCYAAEARRPAPRARPRRGARWSVALADARRVREVATATVATSGTLEAAARRLGCRL